MSAHSLNPRLRFPAIGVLLVAGLAACPSDKDITTDSTDTTVGTTDPTTDAATDAATDPTDTDTPTTGEPAATCPDHTTADACCCFEATPADDPFSVDNVCMTKTLCDDAEFECDDLDYICTTTTDAALQCALETLATGTAVGSLRFHYNIGSGYGDTRIDLFLQGDGTAYVINHEVLDLSDVYRETGRYNLKPKAFFADCLTKMTVNEKSHCLDDALDGSITEACIGEIYNEAL